MANASKDENSISSLLAILSSDGKTIVPICVNPVTNALCINNGTTGTDNGPSNALKDENSVSTLLGVSNSDLKTPTVVYSDINGKLFINTL